MWVTSGSYVGHLCIVLWVNGSTGETHFQPLHLNLDSVDTQYYISKTLSLFAVPYLQTIQENYNIISLNC